MSALQLDRERILQYRSERAVLMGLCGVRFGHTCVCDEQAGHPPIGPWPHAETIGGPLGDLLAELYR